jgi:UDP-N-acetylmuramate dehydrogenase
METQSGIRLKPFNTFGIDVLSNRFSRIRSMDDFQELLPSIQKAENQPFILGGGSNILLLNADSKWIIKNELLGIHKVGEDASKVWVDVAGGENWHDFVMKCLKVGWYGLENLALIPGSVGASPIQNIGAYGVEVKSFIERVDFIEFETGIKKSFSNEQCHFGYRDSIFKRELKGKVFIYNVRFKLSKKPINQTDYRALQEELKERKIAQPTPIEIAEAVIAIRRRKLPDPEVIGNAGSFFKNPVIKRERFEWLKKLHPEIPSYPSGKNYVKVPAGWLIEKAGWKGFKLGDVGVHKNQALVLVNHGNATGEQLYNLSESIIQDIFNKFGIALVREVNVIE